jgi:hypothetical protein
MADHITSPGYAKIAKAPEEMLLGAFGAAAQLLLGRLRAVLATLGGLGSSSNLLTWSYMSALLMDVFARPEDSYI